MVRVKNLSTNTEKIYTCTPREAVIAAYAQSLGDYNTWNYQKYDHLIVEGKYTIACGDWCAWKDSKYESPVMRI